MGNDITRYTGFDGIPFYGREPMHINANTPESKQPRQGRHVYVRIFDLSSVEDVKKYQIASQKMAEPYATLSYEERLALPEKGTWIVMMRWFEDFLYNPAEFPNGIENPPEVPEYIKKIDSAIEVEPIEEPPAPETQT